MPQAQAAKRPSPTHRSDAQGPYPPIEDYGLIGDMRSAALVGKNGSVDWLCLPRFDSPSIFAALLDAEKGGRFQIAPAEGADVSRKQFYWPDTNVLVTRFLAEEGVAEITDYMPVGGGSGGEQEHAAPRLVRRVEMIRGELPLEVVCQPAFDYARAEVANVHVTEAGATFEASGHRLHLASTAALDETGPGRAGTRLRLAQGERAVFALYYEEGEPAGGDGEPDRLGANGAPPAALGPGAEERLFDRAIDYWHDWVGQCTYDGRWGEQVRRSALALKLMTYAPTGAIVAAPTCSLPEWIGGGRNWDYRYCWIRDAAFTVYAFLRLGFTEEAGAFIEWLKARDGDDRSAQDHADQPLQIVYGIGGETDLTETTLDHLEGYRQSAPVRIGNGAASQLQLDIYGELFDAVYLANKYHEPISYDFWTRLRGYADWVAANWQTEDHGIWEMRGPKQQFVYSKLMCWVALDRALRLAEKRSFPAPHETWRRERDRIYADIMEHGWSEEREAFAVHYGSDALDASTLIMPLVFFMSPSDPRMTKTLEAMQQPLEDGGLLSDSLVYRYNIALVDDGTALDHKANEEGTFNMCTFWFVEALTRAGRTDPEKLHRARYMFEKMLGYANHLGLYAEETGPRGEALGNFPQAFTHLSLISAAFNLDRTLEGRHYGTAG